MTEKRKRPSPLPDELRVTKSHESPDGTADRKSVKAAPSQRKTNVKREGPQAELERLRQQLAEQTRETAALAAKLALIARRERELRELLLDAHDQLLRRDEEFEATLAAALEGQSLGMPGGPEGTPLASNHLRYKALLPQVRAVVQTTLPPDATVAVVSRGDEELLELGGRTAWHFPQTPAGVYVGHHPEDSAAAIDHLAALRAKGAEFLLFPATAFWWLEHFAELTEHLDRNYRRLGDAESCVIFALNQAPDSSTPLEQVDESKAAYLEVVARLRELVDGSVPADATVLVATRGDDALLDLNGRRAWHFPRADDGRWAGYYPATSRHAIRHLEQLRREGASHLVFPATAFWWLDYYGGLRRHLEQRYAEAAHEDTGIVFALALARPERPPLFRRIVDRLRRQG